MRLSGALLVLVALALVGAASPVLAASADCGDGGGADCCGLECTLCLCCSHPPRPALLEAATAPPGDAGGELVAEPRPAPAEPQPRGILHVPRPASTL